MRPIAGSVDDVRAVVVGRLRARRDELVREIFARVRGDAFGSAGDEDAEYVAGLRAAVAAAVEYGLQGIEHGEAGLGPIPAVASEQARRAARVGVSLETVLRRYVVGHTLLEQFVMEEADRGETAGGPLAPPAQRSALRGALRAQASVLDRLLSAIAGEYRDELARAGRSPERSRSELVRGLLTGEWPSGADSATPRDVSRELGYDLEAEHIGVIASGAGAREALRELADRLDRRLLCVEWGESTIWAWIGGRRALAIAALERAMSGLDGSGGAPRSISFAVGEPARGLAGWRLTHQQAQAALLVALRRSRIPGNGTPRNGTPPAQVTLTRYADVALLAAALKDQALARALIEIYIAPLEDSRMGGPALRQTLRAYLAAERSVSSAAAALGVVRKTVESRLRTIEEKLGRTLHPCPAELEVALLLDELASAPGPSGIPTAGEIIP